MGYEPCSEDKTIFGNVTKAYNAYYNVPSGCITDNKGENLDTLAGAFLARAAIVDWGLSFIYVEIAFLLLTVFHAFYCTGTGKPDDENRRLQMLKCHKMVPQNQIHLVQGNKFITLSLTLLFRNEIL